MSLLNPKIFRLVLAAIALAAAAHAQDTARLDELLRQAVAEKRVPGVAATVARGDKVVYQAAFGNAADAKQDSLAIDSIFQIASMTKTVTSVAVLQLVERGKVKLDQPASTYLPGLAKVQVLDGFDADGKPKLRSPRSILTVRQLLTHTSGFGYEFFDERLARYVKTGGVPSVMAGGDAWLNAPLVFDPGTDWEYGISIDWLGKLVEKVSGQSLEQYFRSNIFAPLGMNDSFFDVPPDKQSRVVTLHQRQPDGSLAEQPPQPFQPAKFYSGGGGLYSTAPDYLKFTRMLLNGGALGKARVLKQETVAMMRRNQIGDFQLKAPKSLLPQFARDNAVLPGGLDKFGFGFAISTRGVDGQRGAGSVAWAGIFNTFYWIDPQKKTAAVLMMQLLPFLDDGPKNVLEEFERAVYAKQ